MSDVSELVSKLRTVDQEKIAWRLMDEAADTITTLQSTVSRLREAIVELWHESEAAREVLHHYLGMTWEEYQSWAMGKDIQSMKDGK